VENKSGRGVLRGRCVVDATGDADVAFRAGAECEERDNWLSIWVLEESLEVAQKAVAEGSGAGLLHRVYLGGSDTGKGHPPGMKKFRGTDGKEVTEFILEGRRLVREHYQQKQAGDPAGRLNCFPVTLPAMAPFRTTRRIVGETTLSAGMDGRHFDDSVGLVGDWRGPGRVWEIPYGSLLPRSIDGLLAAGRCISSEGKAWEATRVIHGSAHTGEIAGIAASLAARLDTTPRALDVETIRGELRQRGIAFSVEE
ncbi:unnamed protein product, partial [marine sediment metagenome]